MIDFEKEFGHWYDTSFPIVHNGEEPIHHRLKTPYHGWARTPVCGLCGFNKNIWTSEDQKIIYANICKDCLSTYTEKEIIDLKQYLVIKKLKS